MAAFYTVKEHFILSSARDNNSLICSECVSLFNYELSILSALISRGNGGIDKVTLHSNLADYSYESNIATTQLSEIIDVISKSDRFDVSIDYWYNCDLPDSFSNNCGPFIMLNRLHSLNCRLPNNFFYSAWYRSDFENSAGTLFAFGTKNTKYYNGRISMIPVNFIPDGIWHSADNNIGFSCVSLSDDSMFELIQAAGKLNLISSYHNLNVSNNCLDYSCGEITLSSSYEVEQYLELISKITQICGITNCSFPNTFFDISKTDAKIINLSPSKLNTNKILLSAC